MALNVQRRDVAANRVIAGFDNDDFGALSGRMTISDVKKGDILLVQGEHVEEVHFPLTADLSNRILFTNGDAIETSAVGRTSVSGLAAFLAQEPCAWEVQVQNPGRIVRLAADALRARAWASPALMRVLLSATHYNQAEGAQTAACNVSHDAQARLARWLLMLDDRTGRSALKLTQADLAEMLGVQRTTVNAAANNLKQAGAISYPRGSIRLVDRTKVRDLSCECYAALERWPSPGEI